VDIVLEERIDMLAAARDFDFFDDVMPKTDFQLRKEAFLSQLRRPNHKYKRYTGTPLRYAGGKTLAVGYIVELLPNNLKRIISPFFGGGSFEIACAQELGVEVKGFDIFELLVNYWQNQFSNPEKMYKFLKTYEPTREEFQKIKAVMKAHWEKKAVVKSPDELAALFYFNHNTSYGPHFLGWPSSVYLQKDRYMTMIEKSRRFSLNNITVECDTFEHVFEKYPNDFFYCDPPYYLDGDSKTFVGLYPHRNFPIYHKGFKHELLRDLLLRHKGGFILSYNDCSVIRDWYSGIPFETPSWQYTLSQGDTRIGENRLRDNNGSYIKKSHELLIYKTPAYQKEVLNGEARIIKFRRPVGEKKRA
jgi:DNA adenine methylase